MSINALIYDNEIIDGMRKMSFSTNVLEKYDNVTYHCALFAFNKNMEDEIDKTYAEKKGLTKDFFIDDNRVYIARDGVSTKFSIKNFLMKNTFGNINSPMNIATFEIKIKLQETFSCIFTNELEALAYFTGYDGYLYRPYWFEVWFSGFKHDTLEPISRIPLPNGMDSIIYKGCFSTVKSHLESMGTTWDIDFVPITMSILNKNTNILSVPDITKNDKAYTLKQYMKQCANFMFERFLNQASKDAAEREAIRKIYASKSTQTSSQKTTEKPNEQQTAEQKSTAETAEQEKSSDSVNFITIEYKFKDDSQSSATVINDIQKNAGDDAPKEEIVQSNKQQGGPEDKIKTGADSTNTSIQNGKKETESKEIYFTTACQKFLNECDDTKYKGYVAKYDIRSELLQYYNKIPLYYHKIIIYMEKDPLITEQLDKSQKYDRSQYFYKCRSDNSLVKRYQYGYSGADTSVLEVFNNYDMLYFMNALPQTSAENILNNISYANNDNLKTALGLDKTNLKALANFLVQNVGKNKSDLYVKDKDGNITNNLNENLIKSEFNNYIVNEVKDAHKKKYGNRKYSGCLEDVYKYQLYNEIESDTSFYLASSFHLAPELNNDTTNNNNPSGSNANYEKERKSIIAKLMWERLYKTGQMCTTKFTILGDPYWIATQCFRRLDTQRSEDGDKVMDNMRDLLEGNTPNYRCVFTIRSTPDQNDFYTSKNPTDWNFDYSIHASGIYLMVECESIFEDGVFKQKLMGVMDSHFFKSDIVNKNENKNNTKREEETTTESSKGSK